MDDRYVRGHCYCRTINALMQHERQHVFSLYFSTNDCKALSIDDNDMNIFFRNVFDTISIYSNVSLYVHNNQEHDRD
jgi:hypothetical protein